MVHEDIKMNPIPGNPDLSEMFFIYIFSGDGAVIKP